LAAAFCIGSGGSVGSEGPVVQMGSALAALYAKCLHRLQTTEYHTLLACGAASAFATALHTPAAGILYALELVLPKITLKATIAVILATSIALLCARAIGDIPVLPVAHHQHTLFMPYSSYLAYLILGIAAGIVATMFIQTLHHSDKRCRTLRLNPYLMHMSAMLVVGAAYYGMIRVTGSCYVDGVGYTTIAMLLEEPALPGRYLILLLVAKLLLTTMTLGSGGTGGLFAPSLFVGAVLGAIFYMMLNPSLHLLDGQYLICVIAGMAGMVAAMTSTWLLPMVLMFEITHDPGILIPTMIVTLVARALRASLTPRTMYTYQI
jgi:CIC family chloride channel protein